MHIIPARWRPLVFGSAAVGAIILAFGYLSEDEGEGNDDGAIIGLLIVLVVCVIVAYVLWRYLAARTGEPAAVTALVIGVISLILAFFYWTGLVYFVAPVGVALGVAAADSRGRAGAILSVIALAGAVVIGVADAIL